MTKIEIIERLQLIVDIANAPENGYHYELIVSDWAKYGKDRTYFKIRETRENSKHFVEKDYGYYDNISESFVCGKSSIDYRFSGAKLTEEDLTVKEETVAEETVAEETVAVVRIWRYRFPEAKVCEYTYCKYIADIKHFELSNRGYIGTVDSVLVPFAINAGLRIVARKMVRQSNPISDVPEDFDWLEAICSNTLPEVSITSNNSDCVRFPEISEDGTVSDPDGLIQSWKSSGWNGDVIDVVWSGDIHDAPEINDNDIFVWHESTPYAYTPAEPGSPINRSIIHTTKSNLF